MPDRFRFAVKMPKAITHERRLVAADEALERFLGEIAGLGPKLGPILIQLPPSLRFEPTIAEAFWAGLRGRTGAPLACEPRHASWFGPDADRILADHEVARVASDPARVAEAAEPGGWSGRAYFRLHGSPRMYWSDYPPPFLDALRARLAERVAETWCIFDNTAAGAALGNALALAGRPSLTPPRPRAGT